MNSDLAVAALTKSLEDFRTASESNDEDARARSLVAIDLARRNVQATDELADALRSYAVTDAMLERHGRYHVTVSTHYEPIGYVMVYRDDSDDVDASNEKRKARQALMVAETVISLAIVAAVLLGAPFWLLAILAAAVLIAIPASIAASRFAASRDRAKKSHTQVASFSLERVNEVLGTRINADTLIADHPGLAEWCLDFRQMLSRGGISSDIRWHLKDRIEEMCVSELSSKNLNDELYRRRHGM